MCSEIDLDSLVISYCPQEGEAEVAERQKKDKSSGCTVIVKCDVSTGGLFYLYREG